ncbi:MAG: CopG family antitoxin [Candidatus Bipolaricaulia bacterium]
MKKNGEKLPEFESVDEEVEFWENHDVTDFLDELEDLDDVEYKQGKDRVVSVRLPQGLVYKLKAYAKSQEVPYTTLIRRWIVDSFQQKVRTSEGKAEDDRQSLLDYIDHLREDLDKLEEKLKAGSG